MQYIVPFCLFFIGLYFISLVDLGSFSIFCQLLILLFLGKARMHISQPVFLFRQHTTNRDSPSAILLIESLSSVAFMSAI
jgi:hypothetical protein